MSSGKGQASKPSRVTCLCLHLQRAARAVGRQFDAAFRPLDLTNGQFSLLMALDLGAGAAMGRIAEVLAMDRTTLTAALKPLVRRGLVAVSVAADDRRSRRLALTPAGRALLAEAMPVWRRTHRVVERQLRPSNPDRLRADLSALS